MSSDVEYEGVENLTVDFDGAVLRFTFDRPDKRNAISDEMVRTLCDTLDVAGQDERVRVVVLAGIGDHFCSGADIVARNEDRDSRPRVGSIQRRLPTLAHRLIPTLLNVQIPVVCRVQGWAAGIGFQIALASDFAMCAEDAKLWEPFTERGFTPDSGATWLLPRVAGAVRARRMLLLAEPISGRDAADAELVHAAVPATGLDEAVDELVARLATGPTVAFGLTKRLLAASASNDLVSQLQDEAFALELSSRSEDFREGFAAFREKRGPDFRGR